MGLNLLLERAAREALALRNALPGWSSDLSDLEHMVLLAAPAQRLGSAVRQCKPGSERPLPCHHIIAATLRSVNLVIECLHVVSAAQERV